MGRGIIRLLSFFAKEMAEIRRQPRLIISLVLGPFLILALFGLGYSGEQPRLRTILVVPAGLEDDPRVNDLVKNLGPSFDVRAVTTDADAAARQLSAGDIDVVEVIPEGINDFFGRTEQTPITVLYNEIDPLQEQWIQYLTYVQVKELNTALLLNVASGSQAEVGSLDTYVREARAQLETLQSGLRAASSAQARTAIQRLRSNSGLILAGLVLANRQGANDEAQQNVEQIQNDLSAIEEAIDSGRLQNQEQRIASINERLQEVEQVSSQLRAVPPLVLVSPLVSRPQNVAQTSYQPTYITYYSPGVVALLLQHMAVTLAALSLVRENLLGSVEMFRVAPVGSMQIIIGKYLAYTLFASVIAAVLTAGLYYGLGVPFVGNIWWFVISVLLLIWASLGLGFLISAISKSESQAVQFSMIALLASVFFSGFFLPLENFIPEVRSAAYVLPVTHGVQALQSVMLRGRIPDLLSLGGLAAIALVCFLLAWQLWRRNLKRR
jgi:ABC-2 type transport system permease protein